MKERRLNRYRQKRRFSQTPEPMGKMSFVLYGRRHCGRYTLVGTDIRGEKKHWLLIRGGHIPFPHGTDPIPSPFPPMRATLADAPFSDPDWLFEPKWDGVRALARLERHRNGVTVALWGRNLSRFEDRYPEVAEGLTALMQENPAIEQLLIDGEIVAYDPEGKVSFQLLQRRMHMGDPREVEILRRRIPVQYILFDLLFANGISVMAAPLAVRKEFLSSLVLPHGSLRLSPSSTDGLALFERLREEEGEGIVAKRKESPYLPGRRSRDWVKVKIAQEIECAVAGWTEGRGNRAGTIGALLLGLYKGRELYYIGHVGTGFDLAGLEDVQGRLCRLESGRCPFKRRPKTNAPAHWVKPLLVAQVQFSNWTKEQHLREPVFLGLRDDVDPKECRFERALETATLAGKEKEEKEAIWIGERLWVQFEGNQIEVSHLDKVLLARKGIHEGPLD